MGAAYPSDLTDAEWEVLEPMMPKRKTKRGRPRETPFRQILNGFCDLNKEGCQGHAIRNELSPWQTTYHHARLWNRNGLWQVINDKLVGTVRKADGRENQPTSAAMDSQSATMTPKKGERGCDAGKRVKGRKRWS